MKVTATIKSFWSSLSFKMQLIVGTVIVLLVISSVWLIANKVQQYRYNSKLASLEKSIQEADKKSQLLENQVHSVSGIITGLRNQLEDARAENARLSEAVKNAKVRYIEVRNPNRPVFVSPTDSGKVAELQSALNDLYPDGPDRP